MIFSDERLLQLRDLAVEAAMAAGAIIDSYRDREIKVQHKAIGTSAASQVVTEVDHKAQAEILRILQPSCAEFELALLTEESPDDGWRLQKNAFWSIDPMDGTQAFINHTPGFSVSIGLVARDGTPLIGVAYDPVADDLFHAARGQGGYKNGEALQVAALNPELPLLLRTDFSLQSDPRFEQTETALLDLSQTLGLNGAEIELRTGGVMNACGVLETPNSCYFKYPRTGNSGGSLWDYAATACLYREAGAVATDIHGHPMELNRPDSTFMNHRGILFCTHAEMAQGIIELYKSLA